MNYLVTARKWRPQLFKDIIGQESLVRTLVNSLSSGKIPHALLFSGIRGVGKTTTARIVAKALNCQNRQSNFEPCNKCSSCIEITNGYSTDVIEIDGASNRGIDNIRELRDTVSYLPMHGKYKVYIIDEVHMLTNEASNALLKTLEEPPEHVVFILATTEAHKVIPTIKSRCQHYVFKKILTKVIVEQLKKICDQEHIQYEEEGLYLIAGNADGSLRDAESLFDQIVIYSEGKITEKSAAELIGIPSENYYFSVIDAILKRDIIGLLKIVEEYINNEGDIKNFVKNFIIFFRNGVVINSTENFWEFIEVPENKIPLYKEVFKAFSNEEILLLINLLVDLYKELKGDSNERFLLETTLFKMIDYKNIIPISQLRSEILSYVKSSNKTDLPAARRVGQVLDNKSPDESEIKNILMQILSRSEIMKSMLNTVTKTKIINNCLVVEVNNNNSLEYFTKNKDEIKQSVLKEVKSLKEIKFVLSIEKPQDQSITKQKQTELPIDNSIADSSNRVSKNDNSEMIKEIVSLFDGKIL